MPRHPRSNRADVQKVNPNGIVLQAGRDTYVAHEPVIEGMTWEEQIRQVRQRNADGVVIDVDTILESERPVRTLFDLIRDDLPFIPHHQIEKLTNLISSLLKRRMDQEMEEKQQEFERKMKEREDKIRDSAIARAGKER